MTTTTENPFFDNFDTESDDTSNTSDTSSDNIGADILSQAFAIDAPSNHPSSVFGNSNQFSSNNNNNNSNSKKYYIKDLLWLVSPKLYRNEKLDKDEVHLVTIGFNSTYDNMRITFLQPTSETFVGNAIVRLKTNSLTTVNLFSENCAAIKYTYDSTLEKPTTIISPERLIQSGKWQPNKTKIELNKKENKIIIYTISSDNRNSNSQLKFIMEGWQVSAFLDACNFMLNGAWNVSALSQYFSTN